VFLQEALEDYIYGYMALEAEKGGFASQADTDNFLSSLKDA
jgi:hypothetical protein